MNLILERILSEKCIYPPTGPSLPLHSHIERLEGEVIQTWIAERDPKHLLEVGMAYGISSLFICDAIQDWNGVVYDIVDPYQQRDWSGCGIHHLRQAGFQDRFTFHEQPSEICLPQLLAQGRQLDFALIDGYHTFDHALLDFFYINRMLKVGGIVLFDDIPMPSIQKLLAYIANYPGYKPLPLPTVYENHRTIRIRRMMKSPVLRVGGFIKTAVDNRAWDWYCEF
ncbi:class I SAM-dependent methyltransferase [Candidatus Chloroploca asiatica]|uniref:class I SAM-dependent methyltransferase n=1 Tax=Candidatus Chloroploca asiatica TaxID=1506545 RepID=UPI000BEA784B|nr:class I SAM-dependent methyltransferase [Candidatus Chloroploca asiatica]